MPPAAKSDVSVTLLLQIAVDEYENAPATNPPSLVLQFPKQPPLVLALARAEEPAAKDRKSADTAPVEYLRALEHRLELHGPAELAAAFTSELLQISLQEAGAKGKPAGEASAQRLDASPLLVNLPLRERGLVCALGAFRLRFALRAAVVAATHPGLRRASFLDPGGALVPFVFQLCCLAGVPQAADPAYRRRRYAPARCAVELLGQRFEAAPLPQEALGAGPRAPRVPLRVHCNVLCRTEQEIAALRAQLARGCAVVTVETRVPLGEERPGSGAGSGVKSGSGTQRPKSGQKAKTGGGATPQPEPDTEFARIRARARVPLRQLLAEPRLEGWFALAPEYEPRGAARVPAAAETLAAQRARAPRFPVAPPAEPGRGAKGAAPAEPPARSDFARAERLPGGRPAGDWSAAAVKVRAAVLRPLGEPEGPGALERAYVYVPEARPEAFGALLREVVRVNADFCRACGTPEVLRRLGVSERAGSAASAGRQGSAKVAKKAPEAPAGAPAPPQTPLDDADAAVYLAGWSLRDAAGREEPPERFRAVTGFRLLQPGLGLLFAEAPAGALAGLRAAAAALGLEARCGAGVAFRERLFAGGPLVPEALVLGAGAGARPGAVALLAPFQALFRREPGGPRPTPLGLRALAAQGLGPGEAELRAAARALGAPLPPAHEAARLLRGAGAAPAGGPLEPRLRAPGDPVALPALPPALLEKFSAARALEGALAEPEAVVARVCGAEQEDGEVEKQPEKPADDGAALEGLAEAVAERIRAGAGLRGTATIRAALLGRERFMYSGQLLNRPSLEARLAAAGRE